MTAKPLDGEIFDVSDGVGKSVVFEFDSNNAITNNSNYKISITNLFDDLEILKSVVQKNNLGSFVSEQEKTHSISCFK